MTEEPFLAWPGWAHLRFAGLLSLANGLWFVVVYAGADRLTAHRALRVPVHLPAELRIPLVPAAALFYMSLYGLFLLAPFVLRTRRDFGALIGAMAVAIGVAGLCFLLLPAELAFAPVREEELGVWTHLYHWADELNLTYNLLPSLHVTFAVLCVGAFTGRTGRAPRPRRSLNILLWLWASAIAASTVLLHQHHVLDAAAGWLLALLCLRTVYGPARRPARPLPASAAGRATCAARSPGRTAAPRSSPRASAGGARGSPGCGGAPCGGGS